MEASVRYISHSNDIGVKPALCFRGTKLAHCIINDDTGIHVSKIDLRVFDTSNIVTYKGLPYPVKRAADQLISFTQRPIAKKSMTKGAFDFLLRIKSGDIVEEKTIEVVQVVEPTNLKGNPKLLGTICDQLRISPIAGRRQLRKSGMNAPYNDEIAIRKILRK